MIDKFSNSKEKEEEERSRHAHQYRAKPFVDVAAPFPHVKVCLNVLEI
jgi:hypothetical protein